MKNTYRMATEVDAACGRIMKLLEQQGVLDKTLIIFTTDNGNFHGHHGLSEKWYAYEESLRVPLVIKDPRIPQSQRGTQNEEFTLNIDLAPTILTAAGVPVPSVMQGRDISVLYQQPEQANWRKHFLYEFWDNNPDIPNSRALVRKGFKYIHWYDHDVYEVFNLTSDPMEERNIYQSTSGQLRKVSEDIIEEMRLAAKQGSPQ